MLLFAGSSTAQPDAPRPLRLANGVSLVFVPLPVQPNYDSVLIPLHAAQGALEASCSIAGGTIDGVTCVISPPVVQGAYRAPTPVVSGNCATWMAQAGITDTVNASAVINRESGCNPHALNPSSGACGVAQELPCGKSGCVFGDGACEVKWMALYISIRYGTWGAAWDHELRYNWY